MTASHFPAAAPAHKELAALLGEKIEALTFDDDFVVIEDSEGKVKKITPTGLKEVFRTPSVGPV